MPLLFNIVAALAYVIGGVFMKLSAGLSRPWPSVMIFLCFCTGAALQAIAMRTAELGVAYILVLGLEAILAFTVGILCFGEERSLWKLLGVGLVVVGILLLHAEPSVTKP